MRYHKIFRTPFNCIGLSRSSHYRRSTFFSDDIQRLLGGSSKSGTTRFISLSFVHDDAAVINYQWRPEWFQLGRHFIVNLLLLFVRRTAPHRRCRNWQNSFCRLLTLTGGSRCGFSIYFILRM